MTVTDLIISRFTPAEARMVASWSYPPPYDVYSSADSLFDELLVDEGDGLGYFVLTVVGMNSPLGFCCYGPEARVINQPAPEPDTLDIGGGVAPDSVSEGYASRHLPAVIEHGRELHRPRWLRVAVAAFNERSLSLCRSAGFVERTSFEGPGGRTFLELYRLAADT